LEPIFYLNGRFVNRSNSLLSVENIGFQRAFGIFDLFRTRSGRPTFFSDYMDRFEASQKYLDLAEQVSREKIEEIVNELQSRNQFDASTFKVILTGEGSENVEAFRPYLIVINLPLDTSNQPRDIKTITHQYIRETPKIKSLNYATSFSLQQKKVKMGAAEVIYHQQGIVSEASRCNVFMIKDGVLFTPAENILEGITRKHVINMASRLMDTKVSQVTLSELLNADEVFVTSTTKGIMPVTKIGDELVSNGAPGENTRKLQSEFKKYLADH